MIGQRFLKVLIVGASADVNCPPDVNNTTVAKLMAITTLEAKPELTALFKQGARPAAVEVKTRRGVFYREVLYPKGDPRNPMTWADVTKLNIIPCI